MKSSSNLEAFLHAATPLLPWRSATMVRDRSLCPSSPFPIVFLSSFLHIDHGMEVLCFHQQERLCSEQFRYFSARQERFQGAPSSVWQQPDGKNKDAVEYFALSDLWEHYAESSAYGLAVPLRDAGDHAVVTTQHFVPYLSAVQLYTATKPTSHALGATSR